MAPDSDRNDLPVVLLHNCDAAWTSSEVNEAMQGARVLEKAMAEAGHPVVNVPVTDDDLEGRLAPFDRRDCVIFNWCEELPGLARSDTLVARVLEQRGYTFTGSNADVLSLAWDKNRVKTLLVSQGIPTPRWKVFDRPGTNGWDVFPAIVKPAMEHCSFGLTPEAVVLSPAEMKQRIDYVRERFDQPAIVEDFIDGREFHVSIWGNGTITMLPVAEMDFSAFDDVRDRLCTFDSKFTPGSRHYNRIQTRLPAPLTQGQLGLLEQTALAAYRHIGCRDYARLDIRLRGGIFYVLDINPNPDISQDASLACAAEAAGYSYGAMASRMVNLAAKRHPVFGGDAASPGACPCFF